MTQLNDRLRRSIARAAELRAAGRKWPAIAVEVRYPERVVVAWPERFREQWNESLAIARRELANEAADEAVAVLRVHMRSKEINLHQGAAEKLLKNRDRFQTTSEIVEPSVLHRFVDLLEGMSDEEFASILGQEHLAHKARHEDGPARLPDPPSAA